MEEFQLPRTGDSPVSFRGTLLASATGQAAGAIRWYELAVYRTDSGAFVLSIAYRSTFKAHRAGPEPEHKLVYVCDTPQAVVAQLKAYRTEIADRIQPIPEGVSGREKKMRQLLTSITADFDRQFESIVADPTFAERIG